MRIVVDNALPNGKEVFSLNGEVILKHGRGITAEDIQDADALIIRSITKVDAELLSKARKLRFVGTATAGFDHVNVPLLQERGIAFARAPGSNCVSVGDYVLSVLLVLSQRYDFDLKGKTIGVVGCGFTGSQVIKNARAIGMIPVMRDLPLFDKGRTDCGASLEDILSCDFISLHVPLNKEGPYKTLHLIDEAALSQIRDHAFLINASRGPVVDNQALLQCLKSRPAVHAWLDVFEGEPEISVKELLPLLEGATAHIAGYSYESKRRATFMLAQDMGRMLGVPAPEKLTVPEPELSELTLGKVEQVDLDLLRRIVFSVYDVRRDSAIFRQRFTGKTSFDAMRAHYRERRELSSLTLKNVPDSARPLFAQLGFTVA